MRTVLLITDRSLRVLAIPGEPAILDFIEIHSVGHADRLLRPYEHDPLAMARLRMVLAEDAVATTPTSLTNEQVIRLLAQRLAAGNMHIAKPDLPRFAIIEAKPEEAPADAGKVVKKRLTWIEILVINDLTGEPMPWVRMAVKLPSGEENFQTTDNEGLIHIDDIDQGTCDARCDLKNATLKDTLAFVAIGAKTDKPIYPEDAFPVTSMTRRIAEIEEHKVKKGETLDGLAAKAGMKWEDLAIFNWCVQTPGEVNQKLYAEVGCTRKTRDGATYMFDDTDNPGIVYIPSKWEETGLATGKQHIVRVKPISPFRILLEDEYHHRIPEAEFEVTFDDDSKTKGKLGLSGMFAIKNPPWGPVGVVYTDLDDVNAKSLAACARDCFDTKDYQHLYRVMQQGPDVIKVVRKVYDKYYNTYTGQGLIDDIYQDMTEEDAQLLLAAMMSRAGVETREKIKYVAWQMNEEDV